MSEESLTYEHSIYGPGHTVYVDESIRNIHEESPVAGKVVETCADNYYPILEQVEGRTRSYQTFVPCRYQGKVYYVEEEYVRLHS